MGLRHFNSSYFVDLSGYWELEGDLSRGSKQLTMFFPVSSVFGKQVLL